MTEDTPARQSYRQAVRDTIAACERLKAAGLENRAFALAHTVDIGIAAAFLWDTSDQSCRNAEEVIRLAIARAEREED